MLPQMPLQIAPSWPPGYPLHRPVTAREAARIDKRATAEYGLPSLVLMEHAARGIARVALEIADLTDTFLCLCGPGNNGGDGYGAARFLRSWGRDVEVLRAAPAQPAGGDAGLQYELVRASGAVWDAWAHPDRLGRALERRPGVVVDALFGVGLTRPLGEPFLGWVRALNAAGGIRLAVDVPSGMDADTGEGLPECVRAHVTATMAAPKPGLLANPEAVGAIVEIDIGLPGRLHREFLA